jgi:hypothetical protein
LQIVTDQFSSKSTETNTPQPPAKSNGKWLFILSFIISVVALLVALFK